MFGRAVLGDTIRHGWQVSTQIKGLLDYYLRGRENLLVVEAKQAGMTRGFMQLAAELIALDKAEDEAIATLCGAVSIGNIWQFGILHRAETRLVQDVGVYVAPDHLDALRRVLVGILVGTDAEAAAG